MFPLLRCMSSFEVSFIEGKISLYSPLYGQGHPFGITCMVIMLAIIILCVIYATQSMLKDYTYSAKSRMITPYSMLTALRLACMYYVHVREKNVCVWKDKVILNPINPINII